MSPSLLRARVISAKKGPAVVKELVENSIDNNITAHALLTDVHGLIDNGGGTLFLADDGSYKAIVHPPDAVTSVFGRTNDVIAAVGDYAIADITGLTTVGSPTDFLGADGVYKAIIHPAGRQIVAPTLADGTTINSGAAHTTIFDFAPDSIYRNNNCLLTIHYQARNVPGNAQWAAWLRTSIGLTVQQNAYNGAVAMDSNGDERLAFTLVMEGIVSATGNIEIEVRADSKDHDFSNSAAAGKTRLTIELV